MGPGEIELGDDVDEAVGDDDDFLWVLDVYGFEGFCFDVGFRGVGCNHDLRLDFAHDLNREFDFVFFSRFGIEGRSRLRMNRTFALDNISPKFFGHVRSNWSNKFYHGFCDVEAN